MSKKLWQRMATLAAVTLLFSALVGCPQTSNPIKKDEKPLVPPSPPSPPPPPPRPPQEPSPLLTPECKTTEFREAFDKLGQGEPIAFNADTVGEWPGLPNIGNTCFMNAAYKFLARWKELHNLLKVQDEQNLAKSEGRAITQEEAYAREDLRADIRRIMNGIRGGAQSPMQNPVIAGCMLKQGRESIKKLPGLTADMLKSLENCGQTDAHELLSLVNVRLSFGRETPGNIIVKFLAKKEPLDGLKDGHFEKIPSDFIMSLTDPTQEAKESLSSLFDVLTRPEEVEFGTPVKTPHIKRQYLAGIDKSMIVMVRPTDFLGEVRKTLVEAPEKLDIKYIKTPVFGPAPEIKKEADMLKNDQSKTMNLSAVIVHEGPSMSGGHYYAYIKGTKGWYRHDDSNVTLYKGPGEELGQLEHRAAGQPVGLQVYTYLYEE